MSERLFTFDDAWLGGFYEVALEIGPKSDERLSAALTALWSHPDLDGCYNNRGREPADQARVPPENLDGGSHLWGLARLPNGSRVACGTCLIREANDGPDWLDFYLPLGSLGTAYPVGGFPFDSIADSLAATWRFEIDDWLAGVGLWVARFASLQLGLIGVPSLGLVRV